MEAINVIQDVVGKVNEELRVLREDFDVLVKKTEKRKTSKLFKGIQFEFYLEKWNLSKKEKQARYANLTVQLYALVEQSLKDLYRELHNGTEFVPKKPKGLKKPENIIVQLQNALSSRINFEFATPYNIKDLADLRNEILHKEYSLKTAREKVFGKNGYKNNKTLFPDLLETVEEYFNNIQPKEALAS